MNELNDIIVGLQQPDLDERDKFANRLYRLLDRDEKIEFSDIELNQLISPLVKAFIQANITSGGLYRRANYSLLLELIIQKTKTRKNVERTFYEMSEELISNQTNIVFPDDFLIFHSRDKHITPFPHTANVEKIVRSILKKDEGTFIEKGYFFILMPFSHDFDDTYKFGIKNVIETYEELYCQRADEIFHLEDIPTKIFKEIKKAEYILADLTGKNPNVFYELGFAHGIDKKNIILITRNRDDVPFDLRNIKNIEYVNADNLKQQLEKLLQKFGYNQKK